MRSLHVTLFATVLCCVAAAAGMAADAPLLTRDGARLFLGGAPFAAVGVNKHELLDQYMAAVMGQSEQDAKAARDAGERSLKRLQELGVTVARIRVSAFWPAQIERSYLNEDPEVCAAFWQALDDMFADCTRYGIRVVPTIAWHVGAWADIAHESLTDLHTDPRSGSRALLHKWIEDLVTRYRDNDAILFWELTNEANLGADLRAQHRDDGILGPKLDRPAPHIVRGPVIRDGRNNYSSDELAAFTRELARLIKALDPDHLIGTGFSAPRPAAWHLWLGSVRRSDRMDWTVDSPEQQADYLKMITPEPIDIISLHHYGDDLQQMLNLKLAADSIGKPVYIGELGMSAGTYKGRVYDDPKAIEGLQVTVDAMRQMGVPLSLLWTWDEWGTPVHEPVLRPDDQPNAVKALKEANEAIQAQPGMPAADAEELKERIAEISGKLKELKPGPE